MSASTTNSPIMSAEWRRKRSNSANFNDSPISSKKQKLDYFYVLASESSLSEDERSESVDSIQDRETDFCRDTSDTDTKSEQSSDDDYDVKVEYELITTSDTEDNPFASGSSSGEDEELIAAAASAVATIVNNGSDVDVDIWVTDGDDDTDSVSSFIGSIRQTCKKCKIRETVSCFPLCSHCYQARKNCYPPRPKHKKPRNGTLSRGSESVGAAGSVTKDSLSACLTVLSQDSGLGSSQEQTSSNVNSSQELQTLAWDQVVVPENLIKSSSSLASTITATSTSVVEAETVVEKVCVDQTLENWLSASKELCILCHENPKNGIFVHSTGGHLCCCYSCAVKSWTKTKRCAWCNLKAKNVIKAFLV